ncbi:MAG: nickel-dependent hydrogenase large subunit [Burkholderiaceae bacterium]
MIAIAKRIVKVDNLARVEGEGALTVHLNGREIESVAFRIFEPPRFFEAFLRGRQAREAPDITSRICGICPVAYIASASQAVEAALGVELTPTVRDLRRLLYCGEWIQSHVLHAAMLHAPDFMGLDNAIQISMADPALVEKALRLKKLGNTIMEVIGGRAVHPVNTRIGGFYRLPETERIAALIPELTWAVDAARELALRFAGFEFSDDEGDYLFVSLAHPDCYPIEAGRIVSSRGLDIDPAHFEAHFVEEHVAHSNALHGRMRDGSRYLVGPLARYANNHARLSAACRQTAHDCGLGPVVRNGFQSIVVRMIEVQYAAEEALRLARSYRPAGPAFVEACDRAGEGHGCTEAPRGICYHRYRIDAEGRIEDAWIVPPTSQNQPQIEADLARVVAASLDLDDDALRHRCEQTIRNYDPCISCATHFLRLTIVRG